MKFVSVAPVCTAFALIGLASAPAMAFDEVNWIWDAQVNTEISTTAAAALVMTPTGLSQTENRQEGAGSIDSLSTVNYAKPLLLDITVSPYLGIIESSAQSIGNGGSIKSDVQTQFDSFQSYAGLISDTPGVVGATSVVTSAVNSDLSSSATSVVNNLSVDVDYLSPENALSIGNNEQFSLADVSSVSTVSTTAGLVDLGLLTDPSVSSNAAAIGNNFSSNLSLATVAPVTPLLPL